MLLRVREIASLLSVSEDRVFNWINRENLPARQVNEIYGANTSEIVEWAISRRRRISSTQFSTLVAAQVRGQSTDKSRNSDISQDGEAIYQLFAAGLIAGGIVPVAGAVSLAEVFSSAIARVDMCSDSRAELTEIMMAREKLAQTPAGNGVSVPHPRYPLLVNLRQPVILIGQLDKPLEMGAVDGQAVEFIFFLCCGTMAEHLLLLVALSEVLASDDFVGLMRQQASTEKLLDLVKRIWNG
jgi:mannitol/fructose-specific phosphotransferase system IIA component (Ntr-type)/predicted DNA-binding transcriptional regulator AlpA